MGKKSNPISDRLLSLGWNKSVWFNRKSYVYNLSIDSQIRKFMTEHISKFLYSHVSIEQIGKKINVTIFTHKPGVIIGKEGSNLKKLKLLLSEVLNKNLTIPGEVYVLEINISEITKPELNAKIMCGFVVEMIENRMDYRKKLRRLMETSIKFGAEGCAIIISGRIGGASIARIDKYRAGKVSLQTNSCRIFMEHMQAQTKFGIVGVKVYISLGRRR